MDKKKLVLLRQCSLYPSYITLVAAKFSKLRGYSKISVFPGYGFLWSSLQSFITLYVPKVTNMNLLLTISSIL